MPPLMAPILIFCNFAFSLLQTLYETLREFMQEKGGPTPQSILQSLPSSKVTLAQIGKKMTQMFQFLI